MIRLADLQAAEEAVDAAMAELRNYSQDPKQWSAHERLGDNDLRTLVVHPGHFERLEYLQRAVEVATNQLRAAQAAFAGITETGL